jgi:hypothetical protein
MLTNHWPADWLTVTLRTAPSTSRPFLVKLRESGALLKEILIGTVEVEKGLL